MKKMWMVMAIAMMLPSLAGAGVVLTTSGNSDGLSQWYREAGMANYTSKSAGGFSDAILGGVMGQCYPTYWRNTPMFEFALSNFSGTADSIESAIMHLYFSSTGSGSVPLKYYGSGTGTIGYYEGAGTTVVSIDASTTSGWYTVDVTSQILDAVSKGYSYAGFAVYPDNYDDSVNVAASESGSTAPYISISLVIPEPTTLTLLGTGLLALLRRKK